jgi:hypothetical protein
MEKKQIWEQKNIWTPTNVNGMCDDGFKLHKLGSSCYSHLLALIPYDLNMLNSSKVQKHKQNK